jgi:hypothetical protein
MPRTMPRARKRALATEKPLRAKLRARKAAGKLIEPVKFVVSDKSHFGNSEHSVRMVAR